MTYEPTPHSPHPAGPPSGPQGFPTQPPPGVPGPSGPYGPPPAAHYGPQAGQAYGPQAGQAYGPPPAMPPGQFGPPGLPPAPPARSKRWIWITLGSVMAVVLLCVGGAFALRSYNLDKSADRAAASDEKNNPVKREAVDRLVAEHTRALKDRDLPAFLAPFNPDDRQLIAAQTRAFRNLTAIPFSEATFVNRSMREVTPLGSGFTFDLMVGFHHRIGEYDQAPVERTYFWKIVQGEKNGPLKITGVDQIPAGFKATGSDFYPTPWDKWNSVHVEQTEHTLLIVEGSLSAEARRHSAALEAAAVRNITAWKASGVAGDIPPGFVVSLVKGTKELGSLWRVTDKPPTEAGVSIGLPATRRDTKNEVIDNPPSVGGSRVVIDLNTPFFTSRIDNGPTNIFRHELAHSMMAALTVDDKNAYTGNTLSLWVVEGFAEYQAYAPGSWTTSVRIPEARRELRRDRGQLTLPSNDFWNMQSRLSYHYLLGHSAMSYIAEKYGEQKLFQFVAEHYRGKKGQLPALLGVSQEQFEQDWSAYVIAKLS